MGGKHHFPLQESYPYWLNGAIPLALVLGDKNLGTEQRSLAEDLSRQIEYVLGEQNKTGWLGPKPSFRDGLWNTYRFMTAMCQSANAAAGSMHFFSGQFLPQVESMVNWSQVLLEQYSKRPPRPNDWAHQRWQELYECFQCLLDFSDSQGGLLTSDQVRVIRTLLQVARANGHDWAAWLESSPSHPFINTTKFPNVPGWFPDNAADAVAVGKNEFHGMTRQWSHGVNIAHGMMTFGLMYRDTGDPEWIERGRKAWDKLTALHGTATGAITSDENIAGRLPERGTETCVVVEMMNAGSQMFEITGDAKYLDQVERIALNAMPGAFFNGSMWSLNYYQQVNKLDAMDMEPLCERKAPMFNCYYCFGTVYECCVTNHVQGWPRYVARQLQVRQATGSLAIVQYFGSKTSRPTVLRRNPGKQQQQQQQQSDTNAVTIQQVEVATEYPFEEQVAIKITNASGPFILELRIPSWCADATVSVSSKNGVNKTLNNSKPVPSGSFYKVQLESGSSKVILKMPMHVRLEHRAPYQLDKQTSVNSRSVNVFHGPLLYAIPRDYEIDTPRGPIDTSPDLKPKGQSHMQDKYLLGTGEWRHALVISSDVGVGRDFVFDRSQSLPPLPSGQGPFALSLAPGRIHAKAVVLTPEQWDVKRKGHPGPDPDRGAETACWPFTTTAIKGYRTAWASMPPQSPVQLSSVQTQFIPVTLVPYGATNLRIAEFPWSVATTETQL